MMSQVSSASESNGVSPYHSHRIATPPVDVLENADEVLVVADLPGVDRDSIDVRVENDTLTLRARRSAEPADAAPALTREYDEVEWIRSFRIPAGIDTSAVSADAKNGTLYVKLPKAAAAKPRKIPVKA
jgi:HSP20 family protein